MNQLRMSRGRTGNIFASPGGTETILWYRCSYHVPEIVGTNASKNENHIFYNSTAQAILREGGDCATKVGALCACFVDMGSPVKTQVENGLSKLFDLWVQTIDVSDQAVFTLKDLGLYVKEGNKTNLKYQEEGFFSFFMMTVHPDQADPNFNYSRITCRTCVQLPLYVYGIDASIDTQIMEKPHILLVHFATLDNGRKPDIVTLKKNRGDIFSECCAERFKEKIPRYLNEVLFEMVKTALKYT